MSILTSEGLKKEFSRRALAKGSALFAAGAALPLFNEPALAQLSMIGNMDPNAIKINANENPLGPCNEAAEAIYGVVKKGGRYMYEETFSFAKTLAEQEGLQPNYVMPFPGSSDPLHRAVLAFTSADKPFVMADPGYEAGQRAAQFIGSKVIRVPLKADHSHDVKAMVAASPNAGLIYICNPNNPTGTITKRADIEWIVANKPAGSILLLDEAYIHLTGEAFGSDFVAKDKDVIILRTFSKLYGMAGLRAGAALGRPDLLAKLSSYGAGALPLTGMVGAHASLKVPTLVATRKKLIGDNREDVFAFLSKHHAKFVPSVSNKFMMELNGMPGGAIVQAFVKEKIYIGRVWPAWPKHARVSIGTPEEMAKFKAAYLKIANA